MGSMGTKSIEVDEFFRISWSSNLKNDEEEGFEALVNLYVFKNNSNFKGEFK